MEDVLAPVELKQPPDRTRKPFARNTITTILGGIDRSYISPHDVVLLDLLRAIAAILVVLFHARIYTLGEKETDGVAAVAYAVTDCGTQAVFWFFVLSGYLVGGAAIIEVARTGRLDFRRYILTRVTRLYIVLIPALLVTAGLDYLRVSTFGINPHAGFETPASYSLSTFLGNIVFLQTTAVPTFGSNLVLWSLANEFWYYLMFPLLLAPFMVACSVRPRVLLFLSGAGILAFLLISNFSIVWLFSIWCMGALARVVRIRTMKSRLLAITIAVAAVGLFPVLRPQIGPLATMVVGLAFTNMLLTLRRDAPATSGRLVAGIRNFAAFSFSLYVVHLPLLHVLSTGLNRAADPFLGIDPQSLGAPAMILLLASVSILFAYAFSLVTERHTGALRRRVLGTGRE